MKNLEPFLVRLMNFLAEKYKNQLVLKGGILLRLLDSPRDTQDLDYVWIRTKKRNLFAQELKAFLEGLDGVKVVDVAVNSRGIFIEVMEEASNLRAKLEISVVDSLHRPPKSMTTAVLAHSHSLKPQVVATMDLAEFFSTKIAAALERDLIRDLYDLMILGRLTSFDEATLRERLARLEIRRAKPRSVCPKEAAAMLRARIDALTEDRIKAELASYFDREPLEGMETILKASLSNLIRKIEVLEK